MEERGYEMTPYVYSRNTPDDGIAGFLDLARYSSGYASLHHAISFMPETHMLKPFEDRVKSTLAFLEAVVDFYASNREEIANAKAKSIAEARNRDSDPIDWALDFDRKEALMFKGYEAEYRKECSDGFGQIELQSREALRKGGALLSLIIGWPKRLTGRGHMFYLRLMVNWWIGLRPMEL